MIQTASEGFSKSERMALGWIRVLDRPAYHYLLLTGISLFALALRLYRLGDWSMWIDEVFMLNWVQEALRTWPMPVPVSTLLIGYMANNVGTDAWTLRLVPALVGVLSLIILYFPIRRLFDPFTALLATFLMAISPLHLYFSQNVRFYTTLLLFYAIAMFAFYYWLERNEWKYLLLFFLFLGLATIERSTALLLIGSALAYFLALKIFPYFGKPAGLTWKNLGLIIAPGIPFSVYMLYSAREAFVENFFSYPSNPARLFFSVVYDFGLPMFVLALLGGMYLVLQRSRIGLYLFLGVLVPFGVILAVSPFSKSESRYLFMTLPCWAVLASFAAKELLAHAGGLHRLLAVSALLFLLAEPLGQDMLYYGFQNGNRPDWMGAFAMVQARRSSGERVISTRPEMGRYYLGEDIESTENLLPKKVIRAGQRTWFVIDNRTAQISPDLKRWLAESTDLISTHDVYVTGKPFLMRVYLYDPAAQP